MVNHDRWQGTYPLSTQYVYAALTTASVIFLRILTHYEEHAFERAFCMYLSYLAIQLTNLDKTPTEINFLVNNNPREKYISDDEIFWVRYSGKIFEI